MSWNLKLVLKWTLIAIFISVAKSQLEKEVCCRTIFLFATGAVGDHQSALMGNYNYEEIHNDRPYYLKMFNNKTYFFFYQSKDDPGGPGWIVGSELGGNTLNVVARKLSPLGSENENEVDDSCPVGIQGAYDRNETYDKSFTVECEDQATTESGPRCCSVLTVKAEKDVYKNQIVRLGTYNKTGVYNGHALYHLFQYNYDSYLYFRKKGRGTDGWTIGSAPGQETFSITTRNRTRCPNEVTHGFDRDRNHDPTFSIVCETDDADVVEDDEGVGETFVDDEESNGIELPLKDGEVREEVRSDSSCGTISVNQMFFAIMILGQFIIKIKN